ncbi:uncharacterized protein B0H64DRAFT_452503 [Chaetomium fimeti]|uniref:Uncharacterized protein n=1 Tax=Chaetomium fimeti TaxID=1854472 RepID=A0AAE0H7Q4_9PEZI|nr:hypothetical protein B0H64DRAFT_452503 [Chaetomium fimeti]
MPRRRSPENRGDVCPDWSWGLMPTPSHTKNPGWQVEGVGTVELKVKAHNQDGYNTIVLRRVLYIPAMENGIICQKRLQADTGENCFVDFDNLSHPNGLVVKRNEQQIWEELAYFTGTNIPPVVPPPGINIPPVVPPPGTNPATVPTQPARPISARLVWVAHPPRRHRLGPSTFLATLQVTQGTFAKWVAVKEERWALIEEANNSAQPVQ